MRIVILEDDPDQSSLLVLWLEEQGHHCDTHFDGVSFLRAYSKDSYDLVILDWMVPKTSGLEVLKHLRAQLDKVVPVVFITQRDAEEDIVEALEAGVTTICRNQWGRWKPSPELTLLRAEWVSVKKILQILTIFLRT